MDISERHLLAKFQKLRELNLTKLSHWEAGSTGELGYDGPLYNRFLHMTDDMIAPTPMHIKYLSYVYDRFCI